MIFFSSSRFFRVEELVDKATFSIFGDNAKTLFRPVLLFTIEQIRKRFEKPLIINNWSFGGEYQYRGYRPANYKHCSLYSQHRFGNAVDFNIDGVTATEVREDIKNNPLISTYYYITAVEKDVSWVHIDFRNYDKEKLGIFFFDKG